MGDSLKKKNRGSFQHKRDANFYLAKSKGKPLLKCFLLRQNLNVCYCFHEFCEPNPYKSFELTDQLFLLTANELITFGNFSFLGLKVIIKKILKGKKSIEDYIDIKNKFIIAF